MKKKLTASLLVLVLVLALLPAAAMAAGFTDVPADAFFAKPVEWAVSKGVTDGTSDTTFSPNDTCTRGQVVTFLWRAAGSPASASSAKSMDATVYVTATGTKYHQAGCKHLTSTARSISLSAAISQGYTACADCMNGEPGKGNTATPSDKSKTTESSSSNAPSRAVVAGFIDVPAGEWYSEAVSWAV